MAAEQRSGAKESQGGAGGGRAGARASTDRAAAIGHHGTSAEWPQGNATRLARLATGGTAGARNAQSNQELDPAPRRRNGRLEGTGLCTHAGSWG